MGTSARRHFTYGEYLALEEESSTRHEYLDGEIYAMAGGTPDHAALASALIGVLRGRLAPGCRTFTSDLRVRVRGTGLSTYPEVTVVRGRTERAPDDPLAVINPVLLAEVTSPSTAEYDRGEKVRHYRELASVREVLIVSHERPHLTLHRREQAGWVVVEAGPGQSLELRSVACRVAVDDLYRDGLEDAESASRR